MTVWMKLNGNVVEDVVGFDPSVPIDARGLAIHPELSAPVPEGVKVGGPDGLVPGWTYDRATNTVAPPSRHLR